MTFGDFDRNADLELVKSAIVASKQYGTKKFLVDHRNIVLRMRLMDIYDVPKFNAELGVSAESKIALIHADDAETKGAFQYLEDLSALQNLSRRAFTDEQSAIAWLTAD